MTEWVRNYDAPPSCDWAMTSSLSNSISSLFHLSDTTQWLRQGCHSYGLCCSNQQHRPASPLQHANRTRCFGAPRDEGADSLLQLPAGQNNQAFNDMEKHTSIRNQKSNKRNQRKPNKRAVQLQRNPHRTLFMTKKKKMRRLQQRVHQHHPKPQ